MKSKAQIWVSAIIYTMVAIIALVLILNTGVPLLTELKDRAVMSKIKDAMLDLDSHITDLATQGEGSQASVSFEIRDGEVKFQNNQIIWEVETDTEIISPRTSTKSGNLVIASNANVRTYDITNYYIMETAIKNDSFKVVINKKGSYRNWQAYNTSDIIQNLSYNGVNMDGNFTFNINHNKTTGEGNGYIHMEPSGNNSNLGSAKITAHINNSFAEYDLVFRLESYADFVTVTLENLEIK